MFSSQLLKTAFFTEDEESLLDFLDSCRAASFKQSNQTDLCDGLLGDLTSNTRNCKYYNLECKILKTKSINTLMLLHVNVRSLHKNYDILYELIESLQTLPHIICITETRIKNQPLSNLDLLNYSFDHVNSTTNAGGAAMHISDNLKYKVCENQYQLCNSKALWVNIFDQSDASFVIRVIYRHPSQILINDFIEDLSNFLTDYNKYNINYFILGELNITVILP